MSNLRLCTLPMSEAAIRAATLQRPAIQSARIEAGEQRIHRSERAASAALLAALRQHHPDMCGGLRP